VVAGARLELGDRSRRQRRLKQQGTRQEVPERNAQVELHRFFRKLQRGCWRRQQSLGKTGVASLPREE